MNIPAPDIYFDKKIKITSPDGQVTTGDFFGFDYDYDDDGNEFLEFDVETDSGYIISFTEDEIESIEILSQS